MAGMTARGLLEELRRRGAKLAVEGGTLRARYPKGKLADLVDLVGEHKAAIVELLLCEERAELDGRVEVMKLQVPPREPMPLLVGRPDAVSLDTPGSCSSCGDPLPAGSRYRCPLCVRAVEQVLSELRG